MVADIFAIEDCFAVSDYARTEADIFRYTDPVAGGHRWHQQHEIANRAAELAAPKLPEAPHIPPAVEHAAGITEGLKAPVAMPAAGQITHEPKPKAAKPAKPPKPAPTTPPVLSEPNELGFHESTIRRALETFQNPSGKGTREQLLKHLEGHQGAKQEAELTGLHEWLKDKPNVSREDVLKHLAETPHKVRMEEHDEASNSKWRVHAEGDTGNPEYDSEEEAAAAADEFNKEHQNDYRSQFSIEGEDPHYTVDTSQLEDLEEREKELGGEMTAEASRALQRLGDEQFDSQEEARHAIDQYKKEHLPNVADEPIDDAGIIEENEGNYRISSSPLSQRQHARHFDTNYDSEEEAQNAIDRYIEDNWEPPYTYSQAEGGNLEGVPEDYRWLLGPQKNYNETHVAMPGIRSPQKPLLRPEELTAKSLRPGMISVFDKDGKEIQEYEPGAGSPGIDDAQFWIKKAADTENKIISAKNRSGITWKDGHGNYQHIDNPVVRIRHDDRETTDGKKMLFVEEIQGPSDTNQAKMPKWVQDRIYDIGLKRALMKAVQGGYPRMGWTTGNQQADRYNLRKAVDGIEWQPNPNGMTGELIGIKDGKAVITESLHPVDLPEYVGKEVAAKMLASGTESPKKLKGFVDLGKGDDPFAVFDGNGQVVKTFRSRNEAVAYLDLHKNNLAVDHPTERETKYAVEGPDLEVGGRGLKDLYDRELHKRLLEIKIGDKKLKALGVKIGTSEIPNGVFEIVRDGEVVATFKSRGDAQRALAGAKTRNPDEDGSIEEGADTVHSIDIPPELAAEIKKHGVSLYRRRGEPDRYSRDFMDVIRRMPSREAAGVAAEMLRLMDLRPEYMRMFSVEELSFLRSLVASLRSH